MPQENLDAPTELVKALADLEKERVLVPPAVDEAILAQARGHLARMRHQQQRHNYFVNWMAAAAALFLAGWLAWIIPYAMHVSRHAAIPGDINRDGKVDVLDALVLAKQVEVGTNVKPEWDINGDRVVNRQDADTIARRIVKLQKGKSS